MLILREMLAKKMKDESSYLHRQLACKSVALGKTGNNPYTYNWDELYMASPLEKKSRELAVLIIQQNMACPGLSYDSCWEMSSFEGGLRKDRIKRFGGLETGEKGFRSG